MQIIIGVITISNAREAARATKIAGKAAKCTHTMDHTEYTTCNTAFARDTRGVVRRSPHGIIRGFRANGRPL